MSPERVEILLAPDSFDRAGSGAVTGPVWLRHTARDSSGEDFPEARWSDFPVLVLSWWLAALTALADGAEPEAVCAFMDGPFEFRVAPDAPSLVRVRCLGRGVDADEQVADFRSTESGLRAAVRAAANAALEECDRRGWAGRDVDALRHALNSDHSPT